MSSSPQQVSPSLQHPNPQHSSAPHSQHSLSELGGSSNAEDLYLESYAFTTAAAIVGSVDRKIFVLLRDGRSVFGILRTFDQFANLVLQDTLERIYLPPKQAPGPERFAEAPRGVFMVRGENVVMLGELDIDREDFHLYEREQISFEEAERELKARQLQRVRDEKTRARNYLKRGLIHDFHKADLY
ncbi:Sm-like ribonucleo protein [Metschnikowia bicuspidata var. bicuspidata NRRL YB-4993]|uniref:U6 snRNA-associated Sm-like protein LSm1 n=1 Tax=Metschnikowia bicuspidata var. bicuspidata NRRL YB-4993 TaxID=869754 RepID=A0A1A0HFR7_9ASCO|nr:Sm-like ribonucleo protein [Metschnikowia bicuspidata var. bicuspidata NRRL YB-4993]OBA22830.1 Sm-like ribonucleo protein [Metschnikowia bicuspidata var. bicuspidata NRRL YB-4993]